MARRSPERRRGALRALVLGTCAAAALLLVGGAPRAPALAFKKKGKLFPVGVAGGSVVVEGGVEDFRGFPNSTLNTAGLQLRLRSAEEGGLSIRLVDPGDLDHDGAFDMDGRLMEAEYDRRIPGIGDVRGRAASSGAWQAALSRELPEFGRLTGVIDSRENWKLGLENSFAPFRGFRPSAKAGATQDGAFFQGNVSGGFDQNSKFQYSVSNPAGKYGPEDWIHEGDIILDSHGGQHEVALHGIYSQNLPGDGTMRGSFVYTARGKQGTLSASADYEKYKLQAKAGKLEAVASLARVDEGAGRNKELEVRAGLLTATAKEFGGKPRVRVGLRF